MEQIVKEMKELYPQIKDEDIEDTVRGAMKKILTFGAGMLENVHQDVIGLGVDYDAEELGKMTMMTFASVVYITKYCDGLDNVFMESFEYDTTLQYIRGALPLLSKIKNNELNKGLIAYARVSNTLTFQSLAEQFTMSELEEEKSDFIKSVDFMKEEYLTEIHAFEFLAKLIFIVIGRDLGEEFDNLTLEIKRLTDDMMKEPNNINKLSELQQLIAS